MSVEAFDSSSAAPIVPTTLNWTPNLANSAEVSSLSTNSGGTASQFLPSYLLDNTMANPSGSPTTSDSPINGPSAVSNAIVPAADASSAGAVPTDTSTAASGTPTGQLDLSGIEQYLQQDFAAIEQTVQQAIQGLETELQNLLSLVEGGLGGGTAPASGGDSGGDSSSPGSSDSSAPSGSDSGGSDSGGSDSGGSDSGGSDSGGSDSGGSDSGDSDSGGSDSGDSDSGDDSSTSTDTTSPDGKHHHHHHSKHKHKHQGHHHHKDSQGAQSGSSDSASSPSSSGSPGADGGSSSPSGTAGGGSSSNEAPPTANSGSGDSQPATSTSGSGSDATSPSSAASTDSSTTNPKLIVPMYFPSDGQGQQWWNQVISTAPEGSILIANNGNGPGTQQNAALDSNINNADAAGLVPVGYVDTKTAQVPLSQVESQIDQWYQNDPNLKGIFLDEGSSNSDGTGGAPTSPSEVAYYQQIGDYVHDKYGGTVVLNEAGQPNQALVGPIDVQNTWENTFDQYQNLTPEDGFQQNGPAPWQANYSPNDFSAIINAPASQLDSSLQLAESRGNGYVFVNDTPYTQLPDNFEQEITDM